MQRHRIGHAVVVLDDRHPVPLVERRARVRDAEADALADDAVMHVGIDAYLTHLTLIEILTVLVAQRLGDAAVQRLHGVRAAFARHGIDTRTHPLQSWDGGGITRE